MDFLTTVPVVVLTAIITLVGNALVGWIRGRVEMRGIEKNVGVRIEEHRDNLTFQLLKAAKDEVAAARAEVAMFRPLARHLAHFEEAIDHIERLVSSVEARELELARSAALNFLQRMRGEGNLQQTSVSARNLRDDIEGADHDD